MSTNNAERTVLSVSLKHNARPNTPEGKALRIAQRRLRDGQTATEILIEALLMLENVPAPKENFMDKLRAEITQIIHESLSNIQVVGGGIPPTTHTTTTEEPPTMKQSAIDRLRKLARLEE